MEFTEHAADLALGAWVDCYWSFRVADDAGTVEHRVPPDGGMTLAVNARDGSVALSGPFLEPYRPRVLAGDLHRGIRFWPGAGQALLGISPVALRDRSAPAAAIVSGSSSPLDTEIPDADDAGAARIFDRWVADRAPGVRPLDDAILTAVFRIIHTGGQARIMDIARSVGLSARHFRRRFRAFVGLTPKEFTRIRRFRASAIEAIGLTSAWAAVAAQHGYSDQPHLVREYQRLIGMSPERFQSQFGRIDHRFLGR